MIFYKIYPQRGGGGGKGKGEAEEGKLPPPKVVDCIVTPQVEYCIQICLTTNLSILAA